MTKKKQLKILCLVLICLLCLYVLVNVYSSYCEKKESEVEAINVVKVEKDEVEEVRYTSQYGDFSFEKDEEEWVYSNDTDSPVKQSYVEDLVTEISELTAEKKLTEVDALSDYGLDEPAYSITVEESDGTELTIEYGNATSNGAYYMTVDGGKSVYVSDGSLLESLSITEEDFLEE